MREKDPLGAFVFLKVYPSLLIIIWMAFSYCFTNVRAGLQDQDSGLVATLISALLDSTLLKYDSVIFH